MATGVAKAAARADTTVADLLWRDASVYARRREKLAHARSALRLAFERRPTRSAACDAARDFLARSEADESGAARRVWSEPAAYHWVRTLYDLSAVAIGGAAPSPAVSAYLRDTGVQDPEAALDRLAGDHELFALAIAHLEGRDLCLARPWRTRTPLALPGTTLVLRSPRGREEVAIHGASGGGIDARCGGGTRLDWRHGPTVRCGDVELLLSPEAFARPGMEIGALLRDVPADFQREHAQALQAALDAVARHHPATVAHCREMMRVIALAPMAGGRATNLSHSDFPGATALGFVRNPYWLADAFIHEVHHSRLFHLEERGRFFVSDADNLMLDSSYYSPWRDEPRPLHGILHAVYVNLPLWHFWNDVLRRAGAAEIETLATSQLASIPLLLEIGVRQLERHAGFSSFGRPLFDEMPREARELLARTRALGLTPDLPALHIDAEGTIRAAETRGRAVTVRELVLGHLREFDTSGQCADAHAMIAAG